MKLEEKQYLLATMPEKQGGIGGDVYGARAWLEKNYEAVRECIKNAPVPNVIYTDPGSINCLCCPDIPSCRNVVADGMPCVSCGQPSDTATPDDADMCWKCFGEFNATEFDSLIKKTRAFVSSINTIASGNKTWGGTAGWIFQGIGKHHQEKIVDLCKSFSEELGDSSQ